MDILTVFTIMTAVCMGGVGVMMVGLMIVLWKMEREARKHDR